MRHARQVRDDRAARDVLAQRQRKRVLGVAVFLAEVQPQRSFQAIVRMRLDAGVRLMALFRCVCIDDLDRNTMFNIFSCRRLKPRLPFTKPAFAG